MIGLEIKRKMTIYQLPLNLNLRDDAIFDNFFIAQNSQLVQTLKNCIMERNEQFIYCYGESGVGRTHLLQSCCHLASEKNKMIFYLSLMMHDDFSPEIFDALEHMEFVCIDDVDAIIGNGAWEEALFYFYNRARDCGVSLIVSAKYPPQQLRCALKDLQSRLAWGLTVEIKNLSDEEKVQALQLRATLRGLHLSDEVANYLLHRYSRNMRDLFAFLEKLDRASLVAKRRLTIPFVKSVAMA